MSGQRCERRILSFAKANEQRRDTADLDSEGGKKADKDGKGQSDSKNHGGETYYCRNRCIDGLLNMPAI